METERTKSILSDIELAEMARVKVATVRRWVKDGKIPAVRLPNGALLFDLEKIYEVLREQQRST